ncbi:MAG TPA: lipid A deacylase LpxR family protein [Candidatus Polarisedimenticolia bacterium]|nr:lipid A deacylase LpxR family protein [Candidatus Polarisedimenticolia bacterium]
MHSTRLAAVGSLLLFAALLVTAPMAYAEDKPPKPPTDPWKLYLFRFEFDNDNFLGSDDAFTAGWSFQVHSRLDDTWHPAYAKWIGKFPGLGDDGKGGRIARWAVGVGQVILTPEDISIETLQPNDVPYAGVLSVAESWTAYDNRRMAALQLLVGCMGPCSGAESVQKFIHEDLGLGEPPMGWDNQLAEQWLGNANYEYRYKLWADEPGEYWTRKFAQDFSVGAQVGLGNLATFVQGTFEYRFGWGMPMGFTKTPDPIGLGVMLDPVWFDPTQPLPDVRPWRYYVTVVGRLAKFEHLAPVEGGETANGLDHPGFNDYATDRQILLGMHLARVPWAFHLTYYRYFSSRGEDVDSMSDWINLSFEYRF